jgi:hypothetical protein
MRDLLLDVAGFVSVSIFIIGFTVFALGAA